MKKVDFKKVIMALSVALVFLFLGVDRASAQSIAGPSSSGLTSIPTGVFVGIDEALQLLQNKMQELKTDLGAPLPPSVLAQLEKKYSFFGLISNSIQSGDTVPKSIANASANMVTDAFGVTQNIALGWKQEAVTLLSN